MLPDVFGNVQLGNIDTPKLANDQMSEWKQTCQHHCFSTLNHNLAYCCNGREVIKFFWEQAKRGFKGGARSFED